MGLFDPQLQRARRFLVRFRAFVARIHRGGQLVSLALAMLDPGLR